MAKIWKGRLNAELLPEINEFNSSIKIDSLMFEEDIMGSAAHVLMLGETGIIPKDESEKIAKTLTEIFDDINCGKLKIDMSAEDIHSFVEAELTNRTGDLGKKLHTARSRNDQAALDTRMYLRKKLGEIKELLLKLIDTIVSLAEKNIDTIMPGYTHLQRAQPITFAHHLLAYAAMFMRDIERINSCFKHTNISPLGSSALAGTTYPIDRKKTAAMLGFDAPCFNTLDGVSDRDFCIEAAAAASIIMMHLSRFSEEIILWNSWEFRFIELDDAFSTGSSIMPQKKNPDIAELVRGKTGRVYGGLITLLTIMKSLPLAYNKDMQEDKEALFDCLDTVLLSLNAFTPMIASITVNCGNMKKACSDGFINATDCADYLVKRGMPFRDAYRVTGEIVKLCMQQKLTLETFSLNDYKKFSDLFDECIFETVNVETCLKKRMSEGGPARESTLHQIEIVKQFLRSTNS